MTMLPFKVKGGSNLNSGIALMADLPAYRAIPEGGAVVVGYVVERNAD
jgi:hypothetical protein